MSYQQAPRGTQRGRGGGRGGQRGGQRGRGRGGHHGGRPSGPRLPTALLAEVDTEGSGGSRNRGRPRGGGKPSFRRDQPDVRPGRTHEDRPERQASPIGIAGDSRQPASSSKRVEREQPLEEPPRKRKKKEITLPGKKAGDAEDGEIEWLEYALRNEKSKKEDELTDDGLDELLDFADIIGPGGTGLGLEADESEISDDEDSEDEHGELSDAESGGMDDSDESDTAQSSVEGGDRTDFETGREEGGASSAGDADTDEEEGAEASDDIHAGETAQDGTLAASASVSQLTVSENAEASSSKGRYVPPHMRAAQLEAKSRVDEGKIQERIKLERKAQGLLNKLSEANIELILNEIEGLYRDHSRNDVSTILTDLIVQTIADRANLLDSFVILYAMLVGSLHRIVGIEFGAHFTHSTILRYQAASSGTAGPDESAVATIYETADSTRTPLNLLTLIAHLFNAGVVSANLPYDLIRSFLSKDSSDGSVMAEAEVESILRVLRCAGSQLRSEDPASLKDIVTLVQDRVKGKDKDMTTRARFMVETLVNLKGGKSRTTQNTDQDAVLRMKKFIGGLSRKRRVATTEPLRASLEDLLSADARGKWWLVGAGWSGNPLVEREEAATKVGKKAVKPAVEDEEVLLEAARKQGMNTDVRRSIFVILMTSEDYVHACDRLSQLKFTEVQQREFVRVALHCCTTEKSYNPYHALILNQLCASSYSHRFTLQYALWDFLRDLEGESGKAGRVRTANMAKATAYVIGRGSLDLTVFKAIDFTSLKALGKHFFTTLLTRLLLATQTPSPLFSLPRAFQIRQLDGEAVEEAFEKVLANLELSQGLAWMLSKTDGTGSAVEDLTILQQDVVGKAGRLASKVLAKAI